MFSRFFGWWFDLFMRVDWVRQPPTKQQHKEGRRTKTAAELKRAAKKRRNIEKRKG